MSLGKFINPLSQKSAMLANKELEIPINNEALDARIYDFGMKVPGLLEQSRVAGQNRQIQEGVSQAFQTSGLSTGDRLRQVGEVYGRAGEGAGASNLLKAAQDESDKKLETLVSIGKLLNMAYQSSLKEGNGKEASLQKSSKLLSSLLESGLGTEVETPLRTMADIGYSFSLTGDEKRDLRLVNNKDGSVSVVDLSTYLPEGQASTPVKGSTSSEKSLSRIEQEAAVKGNVELSVEAQKLAMKEEADRYKDVRETVNSTIKKRIENFDTDLANIDQGLILASQGKTESLAAAALPLFTAKAFQGSRPTDKDVARTIGDVSYIGKLQRGIKSTIDGTLTTGDASQSGKLFKAMQVAGNLERNKALLNLAGDSAGTNEILDDIRTVGNDKIVTAFKSQYDPAFKKFSSSGILETLSNQGLNFLVNGELHTYRNGKLVNLDQEVSTAAKTAKPKPPGDVVKIKSTGKAYPVPN